MKLKDLLPETSWCLFLLLFFVVVFFGGGGGGGGGGGTCTSVAKLFLGKNSISS